jgi:hypothetical protein
MVESEKKNADHSDNLFIKVKRENTCKCEPDFERENFSFCASLTVRYRKGSFQNRWRPRQRISGTFFNKLLYWSAVNLAQ